MSSIRRQRPYYNISYFNFNFFDISGTRIPAKDWWQGIQRYLGPIGSPSIWFLQCLGVFTSRTPMFQGTFCMLRPLVDTSIRQNPISLIVFIVVYSHGA
jgi:hypothetical protein